MITNRVWLCEKFDQAQKLATILGNPKKQRGYFESDDGIVTHAIGHLMQDATPEQYNAEWKTWSFTQLPMLPTEVKKLPDPDKKPQFDIVIDCLKKATEIVIATDSGQEGEAIARELIDHSKFKGSVRRLWTNALDAESMKKALANLRDGAETLPLYHAALARGKADWYIGMNLTRAYTLRTRALGGEGVRSVGRVQTPTLALVVRRDREIENFTVKTYYELTATGTTATGESVTLAHAPKDENRIYDRAIAEKLAQAATAHLGSLNVESNERSQAPPRLFNLTTLGKAMSAKQGWPVTKTLETAQSLYDKGITTYPRTSGTYLPNEQESEIPAVLEALASISVFARHITALNVHAPIIRPSVFNTKKAADDEHHAIIPTTANASKANLSTDEAALFVLIAQSYLAALMPDYRYNETIMALDVQGISFSTTGKVPTAQGWKSVLTEDSDDDENAEEKIALPNIPNQTRVTLDTPAIVAKKTRPPKRYTEADLAADMEAVAKFATDPAIKARLKENAGIGTVATRGAIIDGLKHRKYIETQGKFIISSRLGREHIDALPPPLTDAAMTALWEERLEAIRKGELNEDERAEFLQKIGANVSRLVDMLRTESEKIAASRLPSESQILLVKKIAQTLNVTLHANVLTGYGECTNFINEHIQSYQARPPSPAQIAFVEKIASEKQIAIPPNLLTSLVACKSFIDTHTTVKGVSKSTAKSKKTS
jgi:DNA topoisomerase III